MKIPQAPFLLEGKFFFIAEFGKKLREFFGLFDL